MIQAPVAATTGCPGRPPLDAERLRADFPLLLRADGHGRRLAYLDNASSSQKPTAVLDAVGDHYRASNANIHRGVYELSERATAAYEGARRRVAGLIGADPRACVFVRNATEAINLVAYAWGRRNVQPGDLIVATAMDHHSNLVPWQMLAEDRGAELACVRVLADGRLDLGHLDALLARGPKLLAFPHVNNALGVVNDAAAIARRAKRAGATVLLDAAQSAPHLPLDVRALGCDFLAVSGHKMLAPTGTGILWGRLELLEAMPPFMGGGGTIDRVDLTRATWAPPPERFEAGTPAIAEAVGLGAAIAYLDGIGLDRVAAHGHALAEAARARLAAIPGVILHGPADPAARSGVVAFTLAGTQPRDVAGVLDGAGVAVRAGQHCCQPLLGALGLPSLVRASFYLYNTEEDVERLAAGVELARRVLAPRAVVVAEPCGGRRRTVA